MIKGQDGIVIVAVLWICALVMWIALQIGAETRLQADERVHLLRYSQAMYLAVGGAYEAIARMGQPIPLDAQETENPNWQPDGKVNEVTYRTGRALVAVQRESDKVNINQASQAQIKAVLEKRGLEEGDADALADVIADFLDPDDLPRLHGAEEDYYRQQEFGQAPFNNKLTSIDQMLLIPGVSHQLFYGFNPESSDLEDEDAGSVVPLLSNKTSLFQMLTVYGNNLSLGDEEILEEAEAQYVAWQPGETYRILSCGKLSSGSPPVVL
jgi:general secretion pathway protein K